MMQIEQTTDNVIYQGHSLSEILESNRRLHAALEMAAEENRFLKEQLAALNK